MSYFFVTIFFQVVSLALDGMTGASQERMRVEHKTQAHAMMYSVNKWSLFLLGTGWFVVKRR